MSRVENLNRDRGIYQNTEPRGGSFFSGFFKYIIIFLLFAISSYAIFLSPVFKIKDISVIGYSSPEIVIDIASEQARRGIIPNNILFFNSAKLKEALAGDTNLTDIYVKKIYPDKLEINIKETVKSLIWVTAGDKLIIDERGVVIGSLINEKLPLVHDAANISVEAGDRIASPTFVKFITEITAGFEGATGAKITKITIFDLLTDVHFLSSDGWTVYFNSTKDPETQLKNLSRILATAGGKKKLEYIDMRLDNRIFYK